MFSPCILLIDNDVKRLVKLEASLTRAGYRVLTAHDSGHGISLAQAALPEVIVCGVSSPSRNDLDVRGTLAQNSQTAAIPFIPLARSLDKHEVVARVNAVIRSYTFR
jgi:DNA-binding response OmpR family regulator